MYSEQTLVARIRKRFGNAFGDVGIGRAEVGIGDDAAVLSFPEGSSIVACSDLLAENTHFRRQTSPPDSVGFKAVAANVSDVGAMGGVACHFLVSLAVPPGTDEGWIDGFFDGVAAACNRFEVNLVGGDLSSSESIVVDVSMFGWITTGTAVRRCGARPGDGIYVTGTLGGSALGLERLRNDDLSGNGTPDDAIRRHLFPSPPHTVGHRLRGIASAMTDISDGLSSDLTHILEESGASAEIEGSRIPRFPGASVEMALHGGEDYELLVTGTALPDRIDGIGLSRIGTVQEGHAGRISLETTTGSEVIRPRGWRHFQGEGGA